MHTTNNAMSFTKSAQSTKSCTLAAACHRAVKKPYAANGNKLVVVLQLHQKSLGELRANFSQL